MPVRVGAKKRMRRTFDTWQDAHAWLEVADTALAAGTDVPEPGYAPPGKELTSQENAQAQTAGNASAPTPGRDVSMSGDGEGAEPSIGRVMPPRDSPGPEGVLATHPDGDGQRRLAGYEPAAAESAGRASFEELALNWADERYITLGRAQPERFTDVRATIVNHLMPRMEAIGWPDGSALTRDAYVSILVQLQQPQMTTTHATDGSVQSTDSSGERLLTMAEAVDVSGVSLSTLKRRIRAGEFPGSRLVGGRRMIPMSDLSSANLVDGGVRRGPRSNGLSVSTSQDARWVLDEVLKYGADVAGWRIGFDPSTVPHPHVGRESSPKRRQLTLAECARLAVHLHAVHQFAMWLMRLMGLRIGEAFGIHVDDVTELPDGRGVVHIFRQGGRPFRVRDADGDVAMIWEKERLKTAQSVRSLLLPVPVMRLVSIVIDVFHTDRDGSVRTEDRLIPGLTQPGRAGPAGFGSALARAADLAGIEVQSMISASAKTSIAEALLPTPKDLRAGLVTDLTWKEVPEPVRKRFAGHTVGDDVHSRHYVMDDPSLKALLSAVEALEELIEQEVPSGIPVPTTVRCTTPLQPALAGRAERIDADLLASGWLLPPVDSSGGHLMPSAEAAKVLGIHPSKVRKMASEGEFGSDVVVDRLKGYLLPAEAVVHLKRRREALRCLNDVAADLGIKYSLIHYWARREHLPLVKQEGSGRLVVSPEAEEQLRILAERFTALEARAMSIPDTAAALGFGVMTVEALVQNGDLEVDDERGPRNARWVTRASVSAFLQNDGPSRAA
ncbi:MAG: helix-turn-helix domain-containing protein [Actinobacteria bacterium]|nr:helix-turn-helix domain-containing protein [Actinomycetota bacterium]